MSKTVKEIRREAGYTKTTIMSLPVLFYGTDASFFHSRQTKSDCLLIIVLILLQRKPF